MTGGREIRIRNGCTDDTCYAKDNACHAQSCWKTHTDAGLHGRTDA